jgi:putative transposase
MQTQKRSKHQKPLNITKPLSQILENGQEMDQYQSNKHQKDTTTISSQSPQKTQSSKIIKTKTSQKKLSTQESLPKNKKKTSKDNQDISAHSTPPTILSQTSDQESTTKEKVLKPFWNNSSKEISKRLWLPTKTDLQDLDSITFNGCSNNTVQFLNQWTKKNWIQEKTYFQTLWKSLPYLQQDITEEENIKQKKNHNPNRVVTRKIRFYPNKIQKKYFNKCFFTHRYFYNKAIEEINTRYYSRKKEFKELKTCVHCKENKVENGFTCKKHMDKPLPWKLNISLPSLRRSVMKSNEEIKDTDDEWQTDIPYDTRSLAIQDAVSAYLSAVANLKNGNIKTFNLKYKSRFSNRHIFWVDFRALKYKNNKWRIFPSKLKNDSILRFRNKNKDILPEKIDCNFEIMNDRGSYYLVISHEENKVEKYDEQINLVALDPGVRSFQTGYGSDGKCFETGIKQSKTIKIIHKKIDLLRSKQKESQKRSSKYNMKKRILKCGKKIYDVVSNLHNQFGSYLCKNYDKIFLPEFETSGMQESAKLRPVTKRMMNSLRHFDFKNKMKCLCDKYGKRLYIVTEEYTSKTCGGCGVINEVGGSKKYKCECGVYIDRDINASRNILIKSLSLKDE